MTRLFNLPSQVLQLAFIYLEFMLPQHVSHNLPDYGGCLSYIASSTIGSAARLSLFGRCKSLFGLFSLFSLSRMNLIKFLLLRLKFHKSDGRGCWYWVGFTLILVSRYRVSRKNNAILSIIRFGHYTILVMFLWTLSVIPEYME